MKEVRRKFINFRFMIIRNDVHRLKNSEPEPSEPRLEKV
jgi:hypothetical protein